MICENPRSSEGYHMQMLETLDAMGRVSTADDFVYAWGLRPHQLSPFSREERTEYVDSVVDGMQRAGQNISGNDSRLDLVRKGLFALSVADAETVEHCRKTKSVPGALFTAGVNLVVGSRDFDKTELALLPQVGLDPVIPTRDRSDRLTNLITTFTADNKYCVQGDSNGPFHVSTRTIDEYDGFLPELTGMTVSRVRTGTIVNATITLPTGRLTPDAACTAILSRAAVDTGTAAYIQSPLYLKGWLPQSTVLQSVVSDTMHGLPQFDTETYEVSKLLFAIEATID